MKIIATIGDCNGIGLEVLVKALRQNPFPSVEICIAGNIRTIGEYLEKASAEAELRGNILYIGEKACPVTDCGKYSPVEFGEERQSAGRLAFSALEYAARETREGKYKGVLTLPVSKNSLQAAGFEFPGQTEFFADRWGISRPMMILAAKKIRVALATIHIPLRSVADRITPELLRERLLVLDDTLRRDFGIASPRIAVLGLNPHAGEKGLIGREEEDIIIPVLQQALPGDSIAEGPFPADGFFAHGAYRNYDGILAMYHDQGLIPLKLLADGGGVNYSAGLPLVRTSPDHGTAFAIAGRNLANGQSVADAIEMAVEIVGARKKFSEQEHPQYEV